MSSSGHYHKWTNLLVDSFNYSNNKPLSTDLTTLKSPSFTQSCNYKSHTEHQQNRQQQKMLNGPMKNGYQKQQCIFSKKQSQSIENLHYQYSISDKKSFNYIKANDYFKNKHDDRSGDCSVMRILKKKKKRCSNDRQPLKQSMINGDLFQNRRQITSPLQKDIKRINVATTVQIIQPILPMKTIIHYLPIQHIQAKSIMYYPLTTSVNIHYGHIFDKNNLSKFQQNRNVITKASGHKKTGLSISLNKKGNKIMRIQQLCQKGKTQPKQVKYISSFSSKILDSNQQLNNKMQVPTLMQQTGLSRE